MMTALVLSLSIPTILGTPDSPVTTYVLGLGPTVLSYVMSFLILAVFWGRHHNVFLSIARVDNTLIWLNMLSPLRRVRPLLKRANRPVLEYRDINHGLRLGPDRHGAVHGGGLALRSERAGSCPSALTRR
ncbi:MAG: DUF1211 domain-containing protein [Nitrososphaerota archaeon]|nr:DUF1211 domain-containing protein [Nitrososphaerota archaeon]